VEHRFALDHRAGNQQPASADRGKSAQKTKRLDVGAMQAESVFYKKLASEDPEGDCERFQAFPPYDT
jgi:U3 small nucleolar RNA-associated protein 21